MLFDVLNKKTGILPVFLFLDYEIGREYKMRMSLIYLFIFLTSLLHVQQAFAEINKDPQGIAIDGYDPTEYFTSKRAIQGKPSLTYKWNDVIWKFATERGRNLFINNPNKYAPQYGGFCSNGLSDGHKIAADPEIWKIINGKLYLYFSTYGLEQWDDNDPATINSATGTWELLRE